MAGIRDRYMIKKTGLKYANIWEKARSVMRSERQVYRYAEKRNQRAEIAYNLHKTPGPA